MANSISAPSVSGIVQPAAGLAALRQQSTGGFPSVAGILARKAEEDQAGQIGQYIQALEGTQARQHSLGLSDIIGQNQRSFANNATTLAASPDVDTSTYQGFIGPALLGSTPGDPISSVRDAIERAQGAAGANKDQGAANLNNAKVPYQSNQSVTSAVGLPGGSAAVVTGDIPTGGTAEQVLNSMVPNARVGDDGILTGQDPLMSGLLKLAQDEYTSKGLDGSKVQVRPGPNGTYILIDHNGRQHQYTAEQLKTLIAGNTGG
jgi:hypothetical protein